MLEVFDIDQGGEDWLRARAGLPTASRFATILAKGRGGAESKTRDSYIRTLAGEIITGEPSESFSNHHMERGKAMEAQARAMYAFEQDKECTPIGFMRNGRAGASPDSLVGNDGLVEIKTKLPALLIECILRDEFPPEHKAQVQGQLWISERDWCDIAVFWPGMPLFVKRAYRDPMYIADLARAVSIFNAEVDMVVDKIRAYEKRAA